MEPLLNSLIKATGWSIFHSLWQAAIVYGALLLVVMALPNSKSKHNLAYGALCLIFLCFIATFFSLFKIPSEVDANADTVILNTENHQGKSTLPQQISSKTEDMLPYIVSIYGLGLCFQLCLLCRAYIGIWDIKKKAHFNVPAEWKASFESLVMQLNLQRPIRFYLSDQINVPLVIGYLKPVVLFPMALASQLDMEQVEAILIHELSHIRRNDYLLNLIKTGIETLLFFNPFVWLSANFINIEREHACDDLVLTLTRRPMTYAHALLKLEILKGSSASPFALAATGKSQHLYQRIKRITDMKTNYMNARQQVLTIMLVIATVMLLVWVKPLSARENNQKLNKTPSRSILNVVRTSPPVPELQLTPTPSTVSKPQTPAAPPLTGPPALPTPDCIETSVCQDTTKNKFRYSIITIDEKGNKKEYRSLKDMPEPMKSKVLKETFDLDLDINLQIDSVYRNSIAFLNSPEWSNSIAKIKITAADIKQSININELKRQENALRKTANTIATQLNSEVLKQINSKEFRQQLEKLKEISKQKLKETENQDK